MTADEEKCNMNHTEQRPILSIRPIQRTLQHKHITKGFDKLYDNDDRHRIRIT